MRSICTRPRSLQRLSNDRFIRIERWEGLSGEYTLGPMDYH